MNKNIEKEIGIIVLNYSNYNLTQECVDNLLNIGVEAPIIIVDNDSPNNSYNQLYNYYKSSLGVTVIKTDKNKGYADGNNYGINYIINNCPEINYIVIMNPDVIVSYRQLFSSLVNKLKNNPDISAISPMMILNNKLDSTNFCWNIPTYKSIILDHLMFRKKSNTAPFKGIYVNQEGIAVVDVIPGSFFMIKLKDLISVGLLDTGTFLYNEENILSIKLKKYELKEALSINDFYFHNHAPSIKNKSLKDKFNSNRIVYNSRQYLCKKYYSQKSLLLALKLCNYINYLYIIFSHIPSKIKRMRNKNNG